MNGHEAVVKLLLETDKVDIDCESMDMAGRRYRGPLRMGMRPWSGCCSTPSKVDIDSKDRDGRTGGGGGGGEPLSWAVQNGHEAVVQLLLETDGKVDIDSKE